MNLYKIGLNILVFSGVWHFPLEARKKKKEKPQKPALMRPEAITNFNPGDGLGGQLIHVITASMYAELHGKEFFYLGWPEYPIGFSSLGMKGHQLSEQSKLVRVCEARLILSYSG
jgi:hypothetical protein